MTDHLSRLEINDDKEKSIEPIKEFFPDEMLYAMGILNTPWFTDITNFLAVGKLPLGLTNQQQKKFIYDVRVYL